MKNPPGRQDPAGQQAGRRPLVKGGSDVPRDATNMPLPRQAPFRDDETAGRMPRAAQADPTLKAESILLEEYNFAVVASYQAKEESTALFNLYLLGAGALATGLGVLGNATNRSNVLAFSVVATVVLGIAGVLSFALYVKLLALAEEYHESLIAMNTIKEFYIQRIRPQLPDFDRAFHWRQRHLPPGAPIGGNLVLTSTIALLGGLAIAGTVGQARQLYSIASGQFVPYSPDLSVAGIPLPFFWEILGGVLALMAHLVYGYVVRARERREYVVAR